jgi:hypothetical protein
MAELGYEAADLISVKIGDTEIEMPIGNSFSDVDSGELICCYHTSSNDSTAVELAINSGDLAHTLGIAERRSIDRKPGYEWVLSEALDDPVTVSISMAQKQGYASGYALHQLVGNRTNNREDYAHLSDTEFANFREVKTSGMGRGTLFRSSSPVNPELNRNQEADEALFLSRVRTVINLADNEKAMRQYTDFGLTHYSECDIIPLNMELDFSSEDFQQKLAKGLRYMAAHDGPYLIHCVAGKDRTGYVAAVLECLMGADADEITDDYTLTYYNYYGVEPGSPQARQISAGNIEASLARAFGIPSIYENTVDLQACVEAYLERIGLSTDEISTLKEKLAEDHSGPG